MYIGGSWLASNGRVKGRKWARLGRNLLEERLSRLVADDGAFSQYSLNYHRVMLDTICMVEVWRRKMGLQVFSPAWYDKARAATSWLYTMICFESGDGPNVGANDGARLLPLTDTDYRDYRPSVQLAMALFCHKRAYVEDGQWNLQLQWVGVDVPSDIALPAKSKVFDSGGFAVLRRGTAMVMLRYPRFRFRPSQSDALHVDLWVKGINLLRDAGTYCYNTEPKWLQYFSGTESHNTVQFDGRDQMPRLGRFLFGAWVKSFAVERLHETESETSLGHPIKIGKRHSIGVTSS